MCMCRIGSWHCAALSNSTVILTRQTCGQRSGIMMAAASKCRATAFYLSVRICYVFLISKCRGESDLGICMTSGLAGRVPLRSADFRRILRSNMFRNRKSALRSGIQVKKSCIDTDVTLLYISILGTYIKFAMFFFKIRVEPAQPVFFLKNRVEPAQPKY